MENITAEDLQKHNYFIDDHANKVEEKYINNYETDLKETLKELKLLHLDNTVQAPTVTTQHSVKLPKITTFSW